MPTEPKQRQFGHYFRPFPWDVIDIYRLCRVFGITDPALQHAIKKIIVAGKRGSKDVQKDVREAIVSLKRFLEMESEDREVSSQTSDD